MIGGHWFVAASLPHTSCTRISPQFVPCTGVNIARFHKHSQCSSSKTTECKATCSHAYWSEQLGSTREGTFTHRGVPTRSIVSDFAHLTSGSRFLTASNDRPRLRGTIKNGAEDTLTRRRLRHNGPRTECTHAFGSAEQTFLLAFERSKGTLVGGLSRG